MKTKGLLPLFVFIFQYVLFQIRLYCEVNVNILKKTNPY